MQLFHLSLILTEKIFTYIQMNLWFTYFYVHVRQVSSFFMAHDIPAINHAKGQFMKSQIAN